MQVDVSIIVGGDAGQGVESSGAGLCKAIAGAGAAAAVIKFPLVYIEGVIRDNFAKLGEAVVEANLAVAREAYELAAKQYRGFPTRVPRGDGRKRMVINGNHALALGAIAG